MLGAAVRYHCPCLHAERYSDLLTAPHTLPSGGVTITVTATSVTDTSKSISSTLVPVGHIPNYDVGVDYHAYGTDNLSTAFITIYNQPTVHQTVQTQLQGMAVGAFTSIETSPRVAHP
jgi:hypothetical protein